MIAKAIVTSNDSEYYKNSNERAYACQIGSKCPNVNIYVENFDIYVEVPIYMSKSQYIHPNVNIYVQLQYMCQQFTKYLSNLVLYCLVLM